MRPEIVLTIALLLIIGLEYSSSADSDVHPPEDFFTFTLNNIKGEPVDFGSFKGKVTLLVNTASQSAQTETQLKSLKRLHDILSHGDKFNVVAFPCNEFGEQEPWDNVEIEEYYRGHFKIEFTILGKGSVAHSPLWKWVAANANLPGAPTDNFHKYLIDGSGHVVKNWSGEVSIETIFDDVQALVNTIGFEDANTSGEADSAENIVPTSASGSTSDKEEL